MFSALFSPNGKINSATFYKGGIVLILLGYAVSFVPIVGLLLLLALIYPWVVLWIKRLRQGGKSGAMVLLYILLYLILWVIFVTFLFLQYGGTEIMEAAIEAANNGTEIPEAEIQEMGEAFGKKVIIPYMIGGTLLTLLVMFIGDKVTPKINPSTYS